MHEMGAKKLTGTDVVTMRLLYAAFPSLRQSQIARMYGIRRQTVSRIINRRLHPRSK